MSNSFDIIEKKENFFAKWINLYGREKRGSFFKILLSLIVLDFVFVFIASILLDGNEEAISIVSTILGIPFWWFGLVFGLRRARDVGFRGRGYFVVTIIPLVGIIIWFLPTNFLAKEKAGFFFRKKDTNQTVMQDGYFNQQHPQHGMQGGYVNQQYVQPQQVSGEQTVYGNQQYVRPQQMNVDQGNQQYAQPQQVSVEQNVYGNQQYAQSQQVMQGGYVNQQYTQPQQVSVEQNVYANQQYTHPQQVMQGGYINQHYTQEQQMGGEQNVYGNQQYVQPQQMSVEQNEYENQQYANSQQVNEMQGENENLNTEGTQTEEKLSVFGDKPVNVIRKEN